MGDTNLYPEFRAPRQQSAATPIVIVVPHALSFIS